MRPTQPDPKEPDDLFRARLSQQLDGRHPLVRLAGLLDWAVFEARFGQLYHPHVGRPGVPIRLMVGLSYLQHTLDLSDQAVVARWVENPYWQYFCGFDYLQLALPIDPSSLVRWRQRIGQEGIELLLQETIATAKRVAAVNHLKGALGDAIHALLCGAGHNLRLILRHLARLLRTLLLVLAVLAPNRDAAPEVA